MKNVHPALKHNRITYDAAGIVCLRPKEHGTGKSGSVPSDKQCPDILPTGGPGAQRQAAGKGCGPRPLCGGVTAFAKRFNWQKGCSCPAVIPAPSRAPLAYTDPRKNRNIQSNRRLKIKQTIFTYIFIILGNFFNCISKIFKGTTFTLSHSGHFKPDNDILLFLSSSKDGVK